MQFLSNNWSPVVNPVASRTGFVCLPGSLGDVLLWGLPPVLQGVCWPPPHHYGSVKGNPGLWSGHRRLPSQLPNPSA